MVSIEIIKKLDDLTFELFQEYYPLTMQSFFRKKFPTTYYLVTVYDSSNHFIKNSIIDSADTDNTFGIKILFRSQIEHYLRFKYIFSNCVKYQSDEPAKKYLAYSDAREELDILKSHIDEKKIYNPQFQIESWQKLLDKHPLLKSYSKKEIEKEALKFTYKNIIKYLKKETLTKNFPEISFWGSIIKEYAKLSSYIHGGTYSHKEIISLSDLDTRNKEYLRISSLSFQMSTSV